MCLLSIYISFVNCLFMSFAPFSIRTFNISYFFILKAFNIKIFYCIVKHIQHRICYCNYLKQIILFVYLWPCWVFVVRGLFSSCCAQASHCSGFSRCRAGLQDTWASIVAHMGSTVVAPRLQSTGSVVVVHGLSCSAAGKIFPNQG